MEVKHRRAASDEAVEDLVEGVKSTSKKEDFYEQIIAGKTKEKYSQN